MKRISLFLSVFLAAIFLTSCSFSLAEDITPPPNYQEPPAPQVTEAPGPFYPASAPDPANGQALYAENCAPCHGETGLGDGEMAAQLQNPPTALGDPAVARQASPSEWYGVVTNGRMDKFMPPFNSLTDQQRWDVVAYAFNLSVDPQAADEASQVFNEECSECHAPQGEGSIPVITLSDPKAIVERSAAELYTAITDGANGMPGYKDSLTDEQRWALADYSRSLMFAAAGDVQAELTPVPATQAAGLTPMEEISGTTGITTTSKTGLLGGKLINQSGEDLPADQTVTIHAFDNMTLAQTYTATVQPDGSFSVGMVEMPQDRVYMASIVHNGATYTSDIVTVQSSEGQVSLDVPIFGTTTDPSMLTVDRMHLFFDFSTPGTVQVVELYLITNPTDRTVVPEEPGLPVITFHLPEGATNLKFQDSSIGARYVEVPGGFGDTLEIAPGSGQHQVLFGYDMEYNRKLNLSLPQTLPVGAVTVLMPENGVQVKSDQLQDGGTRDVQGQAYHMYNGSALNPGDTLDVSLSGSPGGGGSLPLNLGNTSSLVIGLAGLGVMLVILGVVLYIYSRRSSESQLEPAYEENEDNLMDAIIALDDSYKEGSLSEEAYLTRRADLKDQLKRLQDDRG